MITVTTTDGVRHEFATASRFLTEDVFNNLCLHDGRDTLVAAFAAEQWKSVEVT